MMPPPPVVSANAPPYILVTFAGSSVAGSRAKCDQYGHYIPNHVVRSTGLMAAIREAFHTLRDTRDDELTIDARLPGFKDIIRIVPSLWPDIYATVVEVIVHVPLTEAERRRELITKIATSIISVKIPDGQTISLKINLNYADARDLKSLLEEKSGVPVERQILVLDRETYAVGDGVGRWISAGTEIPEEDVLIQSYVTAGQTLHMRLAPRLRETPSLDAVVRSGY